MVSVANSVANTCIVIARFGVIWPFCLYFIARISEIPVLYCTISHTARGFVNSFKWDVEDCDIVLRGIR